VVVPEDLWDSRFLLGFPSDFYRFVIFRTEWFVVFMHIKMEVGPQMRHPSCVSRIADGLALPHFVPDLHRCAVLSDVLIDRVLFVLMLDLDVVASFVEALVRSADV